MSQVTAGKCRYCGCTEDRPCAVPPYGADDTCAWVPGTGQTVCTRSSCQTAWAREQKRAQAAAERQARETKRKHGTRYVGMGYGAIVADMRKRERQRRRGKQGVK